MIYTKFVKPEQYYNNYTGKGANERSKNRSGKLETG